MKVYAIENRIFREIEDFFNERFIYLSFNVEKYQLTGDLDELNKFWS